MDSPDASDPELLHAWVHQRNEGAFEALAGRYRHLVHQTALRISGDDALAADATQLVFILLARKAPGLAGHPSLAGWLHHAGMRISRELIRKKQRETRKIQHYQAAMETPSAPSDASWKELQPALDAALGGLSGKDREALLLRFYRGLGIREVGSLLGIQPAAAQKRIDRALERLRRKLARRGCALTAPLAGVLLAGFAADAQAAAVPAASLLAGKAISATAATTGGMAASQGLLGSLLMKSTPASIPALVLVAGGLWLASQFHAIATLRQAQARMAQSIRSAEPEAPPPAAPPSPTALDGRPVDWAAVARQLRENKAFYGITPHARLEEQFHALSSAAVQAALDEVEQSRLTDDDRDLLRERLGDEWIERGAYRLTMDRFLPLYGKGTWKWTLGGYFKRWIQRQPDEAIRWLSENIAQMGDLSFGFLDSSLHPLLEHSPETAGRLLAAIPPERRLESMRSLEINDFTPTQQSTWAGLVRRLIPEQERLKGITWPTLRWSDGDGAPMPLAEISAYKERIQACPAERAACVMAAAHDRPELASEDGAALAASLRPFREWVRAHDPSLLDKATGLVLFQHLPYLDEDPLEILLDVHARLGGDEILLPFVENQRENDKPDFVRRLAERMKDEALRRKTLESIR